MNAIGIYVEQDTLEQDTVEGEVTGSEQTGNAELPRWHFDSEFSERTSAAEVTMDISRMRLAITSVPEDGFVRLELRRRRHDAPPESDSHHDEIELPVVEWEAFVEGLLRVLEIARRDGTVPRSVAPEDLLQWSNL